MTTSALAFIPLAMVLSSAAGARPQTSFESPVAVSESNPGRFDGLPRPADIDGDDDLVTGFSEPDGRLVILRSEGGRLIEVHGPVQGNTASFTLHDFDADGDLDLYFIVEVDDGNVWRIRVAELEGALFTGNILGDVPIQVNALGHPPDLEVADFDGDGRGGIKRGGLVSLATPTGFSPNVGFYDYGWSGNCFFPGGVRKLV